ncbi:hypothetical protein [Sphingomonas trueperi]|uniref:Uncharacterized protein n=1 Tax=Sphingomonas trueperi TaxID=53317 RepID=A0A7X5Y2K3_9SPHN|nr:hypothetical protein [Sphingomonas trueperi]NJB99854.1 hypothetical protein [Sphingomonas trueperi]
MGARPVVALPDPAELAKCPQVYASLGALPKLESYRLAVPATVAQADGASVTLPAGTELVPMGVVLAREGVTFSYAMAGRDLWQRCASTVRYTVDWSAEMAKPK